MTFIDYKILKGSHETFDSADHKFTSSGNGTVKC